MAKTSNNTSNRSYELKKLKAECVAEENRKYNISQKFRHSGKKEAVPGNTGLKTARGEIYLLLACNDEAFTNSILEQFKGTKNFKKVKTFSTVAEVYTYMKDSKFSKNSIIICIYAIPQNASEEDIKTNGAHLSELKKSDPSMDIMIISANKNSNISDLADFNIIKSSEPFSKIITNITWAIREQDRIRKQVEAKQFIKMAIIVFFSFFIILFLIDFITGILSPVKQGFFGIIPIPQ